MNRTFIELPLFRSKWKNLGLTEEERNEIRKFITILEHQLKEK